MTPIDDLICKVECQDLINRFAVFRDKPEEVGYDAVFTDDATFVSPGGHAKWGPGSELTGAALRSLLTDGPVVPFHVVHIFTNIVIVPTSPGRARGTAYMIEYLVRDSTDRPLPQPISDTPNLIGDRVFEFRRTPAGWRISRYEMYPVLSAG